MTPKRAIFFGFVCLIVMTSAGLCEAATAQSRTYSVAPIRFRLINDVPVINASLNGVAKQLAVDLGAFSPIGLLGAKMQDINVEFDGSSQQWRNAEGDIFVSKGFLIKDFQAGPTNLKNVRGNEIQAVQLPDNVDGYVGFGILKNFTVIFDYPRKDIYLYWGDHSEAVTASCGAERFPISVVNGVTEVSISSADKQFTFQLDTGSRLNLLRPTSALGTHTPRETQAYRFSDLQIGKVNVSKQSFVVRNYNAPDVDGVLGAPFFKSNIVCLDFPKGEAAIKAMAHQ